MCVIVAREDAEIAAGRLRALGETVHRIGEIVSGIAGVHYA
jgi:hypothetical protein